MNGLLDQPGRLLLAHAVAADLLEVVRARDGRCAAPRCGPGRAAHAAELVATPEQAMQGRESTRDHPTLFPKVRRWSAARGRCAEARGRRASSCRGRSWEPEARLRARRLNEATAGGWLAPHVCSPWTIEVRERECRDLERPGGLGTTTNSHVREPRDPADVVSRLLLTAVDRPSPRARHLGRAIDPLRLPRPSTLKRNVAASPNAMLERSTDAVALKLPTAPANA